MLIITLPSTGKENLHATKFSGNLQLSYLEVNFLLGPMPKYLAPKKCTAKDQKNQKSGIVLRATGSVKSSLELITLLTSQPPVTRQPIFYQNKKGSEWTMVKT